MRVRILLLVLLCAFGAAACGDAEKSADFGPPIVVDQADYERWVWIAEPTMRCADGSEGGFAVNFTAQSRELVVYLFGGGVCYDLATCTIDQPLLQGLGENPLEFLFGPGERGGDAGIFDRSDATNPFRKSNFVVLPHCTGDGHAANKVSTYPPLAPVQQVGYANVTAALQRIVPTFRDASRVTFAGFSAGGIGVGVNYHQFASAFESVGQPPPVLINDAGPTLREPYLSRRAQDKLIAGWGLDETVGPWCPECLTGGLHLGQRRLAELHPGMRSSLVCATSDVVVFGLYALLNGDTSSLEDGLFDLSDWIASYQAEVVPTRQREFLYPGDRHGAMVVAPLAATPGLAEFLTEQLDGDPAWSSVRR
jgi:hypothetical protein